MKGFERTVAELTILADLPDSKIDTSDIPEKLDWTGAVRGRFRQSTASVRRPISAEEKSEIRRLSTKGMSSKEIAARLGVAREQVSAIKAHVARGSYTDPTPKQSDPAGPISREWLIRLQARRKSAADKKRIEFTLNEPDFVAELYERQGGRCAVSGIKFNLQPFPDALVKLPFAPSIDRKLASRGYTKNNVRLVCVAVNFALNQWGDEVFLTVARGAVACESRATNALFDVEADANWEAELRTRITAAEELLKLLPLGLQPSQRKHIAGLRSALTKGLARSRAAAEESVKTRRRNRARIAR
jgi:transposase-like protein